eukprot:SAG11_NODE_18810_length_480_cov_20.874016_1_plen_131_part_01
MGLSLSASSLRRHIDAEASGRVDTGSKWHPDWYGDVGQANAYGFAFEFVDEDGLAAIELYEEALMLESSRDNNSNGDTEPGVRDVLNAVVEAVEVHALVSSSNLGGSNSPTKNHPKNHPKNSENISKSEGR